MGCLNEEDDQFFDTREEITSVCDLAPDCLECSGSDLEVVNSMPSSFGYEIWIKNPGSIQERRDKFLKWMGLSVDRIVKDDPGNGKGNGNASYGEVEVEINRLTKNSEAVLGSLKFYDEFSSSQSSMSCWSNDARELSGGATEGNYICRIRNLDDGTEFIVDELGQDGMLGGLREVDSNRLLTLDEFERSLGLYPLVQQVMQRDVGDGCDMGTSRKKLKKGWLRRLGSIACIVNRQMKTGGIVSNDSYVTARHRNQTVRVRANKKRSKELSALYMAQDIHAHEGSILTMKFSPDGHYLASAGEDGIVRLWQVVESEISEDLNASHPSCVYFTKNNLSEFVPLCINKEKKGKSKGVRKTSDSACVILPQKVFQIYETPIHEFQGHCGEVLDLSWSSNKYLLSSSIDKTVRLWRVGHDQCLQVFSHNNYVTCVQFNPVDDNYFISGSVDGKIRIWAIPDCQVVDWTDISDIVTAICYRPDGKGVIVGSMTGSCRFYDASDNRLQLYAQICLWRKKKSPFRRITGITFLPNNSTKVMVSSADSQVRILDGVDVICKFRGLHNSGSQISASFTSDGMHLVSVSGDSNVYMWNYFGQDDPVPQSKSIWPCERFFSNNASVAIPWCGTNVPGASLSSELSINLCGCPEDGGSLQSEFGESSQCKLLFSSPDHFTLNRQIFSEPLPRGSATWPEEKLPSSSSLVVSSAMCKSQYKFLETSFHSIHSSPHAWGLVIVTAGWDGRIRSFQNYGLPIRL